ncbi:putative secreted protein (Por secretion system target) [Flavobacterium endophyticum]|uniref:Putative secreted protein (Por secretion system target) n=1 Tax=Flavobacterium endophyticum TaxID=1540163 RepID=A0A495LZ36_9FLAO|nr:ice-binding family protein [Flavobacterium endophyticum]RKS19006.1 putative secreted protein (Por secretion system target) [Flavobacterium endophyticum]
MNITLRKVIAIALIFFPLLATAQAPPLGTTANFVLFSSNGAVSNTGLSHLTGHVGTNNGSSTNFGNVDGVMHDADGTTAIAAADLTIAYNFLDAAIPGFFPASLLGNGQILNAGTYSIGQSATLDNILTLDGQGNPNAVFIIQIEGAFSSTAGSKVLLANGAQACNVFWKIEGLVNLATNTSIKGTIVANNAAIILNTGVALEGRVLSTTGAVTVAGVTARKPVGCGSPELTGPVAPPLATVACYTIFSGNGGVANTGITFVTGDIGTNVGLVTGFQAENVTGTIHPNPDVSTAQCALDLNNAYAYLNTLPVDIQLLFPASFGNDLVLTPHTYFLDAATILTGKVTFNAQGNPDAVFVLKISGAFSTSTYAVVELINGAEAKNIFWKIDGATNLNDYAAIKGTLIGNNGAVILNTGVEIEGRVLSTTGAISTFAIDAQMTPGCASLGTDDYVVPVAKFYPNPFSTNFTVAIDYGFQDHSSQLIFYNVLGALVLEKTVTKTVSDISVNLPSGLYFYKLLSDTGKIQSGKIISK